MRRFCLSVIRTYQVFVSPLFGRACRFEPTCSHYAYDAIARYGAWPGVPMAMLRLVKCHPFHPGGEDPVR